MNKVKQERKLVKMVEELADIEIETQDSRELVLVILNDTYMAEQLFIKELYEKHFGFGLE